LIRCSSEDGGIRTYTTALAENEVRMRETEHFLARVYKGSVSMMLSAMTDGKKLDDTEIDALYEILRQAEEKK
ncbi:MAG: BlaI/MecI/CopY family transcriptional regulator, partial [Clostridia bacterium]|nr:BlaI/MecI/CopY family transcriptional regulator [Clostridia bacterium]